MKRPSWVVPLLRRGLAAALGAGPLLVALRAGLVPGQVWGAPTAGALARIHAWWVAAAPTPPVLGFPLGSPLPAEPLARLAAPLTRGIGAPAALFALALLHLVALLLVSARATRERGLAGSAVATAVFSASPAVFARLAEGDPEALAGWAVLLTPLLPGPLALVGGAVAGLLAPGLVPVAILHGALLAWPAADPARRRTLGAAAVLAGALALAVGLPAASTPTPALWWSRADPGPDPTSFPTFVGFVPLALLAVGALVPEGRRLALGGGLALLIAAVRSPLDGERFLLLVPLYAALGGLAALRRHLPAHEVSGALLIGALILGEGWQAGLVPVPTSALAIPAPVRAVPEGPVLDLPASTSASPMSRYLQTAHGQPIASDAEGLVEGRVQGLVDRLGRGECVDPARLGFRAVLARREQAFRQLGPLQDCLGAPTADDGEVALWILPQREVAPGEP